MQKEAKFKLNILLSLAILILAGGVFFFSAPRAEAKVTKWQKMLEAGGIPQSFWQGCLPKVTRSEYNRVKNNWAKSNGTVQATEVLPSLGPEISVGLWYNSKDDIFKIDANKTYNIRKEEGGEVVAQVSGDSTTRVKYESDGKLKVYSSISETLIDGEVWFDAADGDNSSIVFDVHHDVNYDGYDHFRGKIRVFYYDGEYGDIYNGNPDSKNKQIWIINKLPLEQYVWGMGETTGTGDADHTRVMATIFRTYGQWYIDNATKYKKLGFKIRSDSGSQIYVGYNREEKYPRVRESAEETRGKIIKYKDEVALTPYCSYTDGKTRKMNGYPYLKSVKDPYGKKKGLKPGQDGNHMWGLSAHGSLGYAEHGKSWDWILKHYYSKVDISNEY
jgi:peptidoglycan hydrolase-like amidase